MAALQRRQAARRNRPGGYWIAETHPAAAYDAIRVTIPADQSPWAIVAADGAYAPMGHLGITDWPTISAMTTADLHDIVTRCHTWEHGTDPDARTLPRAKRHDDKTLTAVRIRLLLANEPRPAPIGGSTASLQTVRPCPGGEPLGGSG